MGSTSDTQFATQRQTIDEEIEKLEATLVSLKRRRNTFITFNHLPLDILSYIFIAYKESLTPTSELESQRAQWITILGVCSHWREVVLNTPRFWASISLATPLLVQTMLAYSKQAPIHLRCPLSRSFASNFWNEFHAALVESYRLEGLSVSFNSLTFEYISRLLDTLNNLKDGVVSLRSIKLNNDFGMQGAILERSLPWCKFPYLQSLELNGVLFPPDTPLLPSLIDLSISCDNRHDLNFSVTWIVTFLRQIPNLENLHIFWKDTIGSRTTEASDSISTPRSLVSLPKLRTIVAHIDQVCDVKLFDWLEFPSSTAIQAKFPRCKFPSQAARQQVLMSLQALFSRLSVRGHERIQKIETSVHTTTFALKLFFNGGDKAVSTHQIDLPINPISLGFDTADYFSLCRTTLPLDQIIDLTIEDSSSFLDPPRWWDMLSVFKNLTILNFKSFDTTPMCDILLHLLKPSDEAIKFRALESISFYKTHCYNELQKALGVLWKTRQDVGAPLPKLVLKRCTISPQQVDVLRGYVNVDWDGITSPFI
ncbi:hypothetical protein ONZ45_g16850 [Pleurotus djamor]|nr:hypothetical protein ONZ45_g16850 [Pleurotus djamor]